MTRRKLHIFCNIVFLIIGISSSAFASEISPERRERVIENSYNDNLKTEQNKPGLIELDIAEDTLQLGGIPREKSDDSIFKSKDPEDKKKIKEVYGLLEAAVSDKKTDIELKEFGLSTDDASEMVSSFLNDNPDYFYVEGAQAKVSGQNVTSLVVQYSPLLGSDSQEEEYEEKIAEILSGINPDWPDSEKLLYLHDYLVTHCQYDRGFYTNNGIDFRSFTAYGAIVLGKAVCQGYSEAYCDLANRAGIDTVIVSSDTMNHAWNLVEVNGEHYYVDCTWDDPITDSAHMFEQYCEHYDFLKSETALRDENNRRVGDDWCIGSDFENSICGLYEDTSFDNACWGSSDISPVVCLDDGILYLDSTEWEIHKTDASGQESQKIVSLSDTKEWPVFGSNNSFYGSAMGATLTKCGNSVFVNDYNTVYILNDNNTLEGIYTLRDNELAKGYIFGITEDGVSIKYFLATNYFDTDLIGSYLCDTSGRVSKVILNKSSLRLNGLEDMGESITATILAGEGDIGWSSSDTSVITVDEGNITPVNYGKAYITADLNGCKASCLVYVDSIWQEMFEYITYENKIQLQKYIGTKSEVEVPSFAYVDGARYEVEWQVEYGEGRDIIKKIKFSPGVTVLRLAGLQNLESVVMDGVNYNLSSSYLFVNCKSLKEVDLSKSNSGGYNDFSSMFDSCASLKRANLREFGGDNIRSMQRMFYYCTSLENVDLGDINTANVTDFSYMFFNCVSLKSLDLSSFDAGNATDMTYIFSGCSSLEEIKTPVNLPKGIEAYLPDTFIDSKGNRYTTLPTELSESIDLKRVDSEDADNIDDSRDDNQSKEEQSNEQPNQDNNDEKKSSNDSDSEGRDIKDSVGSQTDLIDPTLEVRTVGSGGI